MSGNTFVCPWCGVDGEATTSEQQICGSIGDKEISETISVWKCRACDFWIQWEGTDVAELRVRLEDEKKDRSYPTNMLTGQEIRELRERHGLSRKELELLTGFGEASIKRWERGAVHNASVDTFLRLIDDGVVMERLRQLKKHMGH
jgi:putative zinc finger/helix-turn-helix YgiT family protein